MLTAHRIIHAQIPNVFHTAVQVTLVVWDEADTMLRFGFKKELDLIMSCIREDKQILFFSATWPQSVREMACDHVLGKDDSDDNVVIVGVGDVDQLNANENVTQKFIFLENEEEKPLRLWKFLKDQRRHSKIVDFLEEESRILVFFATVHRCKKLHRMAIDRAAEDFRVQAMYGGMHQKERKRVLKEFKDGTCKILFATNVVGRGIHVDNIDYVVNYDLPHDKFENYVHRIGRTGRAGRKGTAISYFVPEWDSWCAKQLIEMLKSCNQPVPEQLIGMENTRKRRKQGDELPLEEKHLNVNARQRHEPVFITENPFLGSGFGQTFGFV